jgi:hypothetical protein
MSIDNLVKELAAEHEVIDGLLIHKISKCELRYSAGRYKSCTHKGKNISHHRIIFYISKGYLPAEIDHIDGNPMNNLPGNLRAATHAENARNRSKWSGTSSKLKGVYWCKRRSKFISQIRFEGKTTYLGQFDTEEEAHALWADTAHRLYGEFFNKG